MHQWYVGIDLGEAGNHTAVAALDRVRLEKPLYRQKFRYVVRLLEEYELGLDYPAQIERLKATLSHPALKGARVAPDYTGVGRPVIQMMKTMKVPGLISPVLITAGHRATWDEESRGYHVPKRDLVATLQVLLQADLVGWHPRLPAAKKLERQLANFKVRITKARNETFGAEGRDQDDLVLAVMLAAWLGEHAGPGDASLIATPPPGTGNVTESAPPGVFIT